MSSVGKYALSSASSCSSLVSDPAMEKRLLVSAGRLGKDETENAVSPLRRKTLSFCGAEELFRAICRAPKKAHPKLKRDWQKFPAVLIDTTGPTDLWAIGDIHGDYKRATHLLRQNKLISDDAQGTPHWSGGRAHLVSTGDLIDKGPENLRVVDLFRRLQTEASRAGGRVVVTMGNHEVDLLANPRNSKAIGPGGIAYEFMRENLTPEAAIAPSDPRGAWWRSLPLAYVAGDILFSHAGQTSGRSQEGLEKFLEQGLERDGYKSLVVKAENSIVRARNFYGSEAGEQGPRLAALAGVKTLAFGHDPQSLSPWGKVLCFGKGSLVRLDTGSSRGIDFSHGELFHASVTKQGRRYEACDYQGKVTRLDA